MRWFTLSLLVLFIACSVLKGKPTRVSSEPDTYELEFASIMLGQRKTVGQGRHAVGDPVEGKWDKDGKWYHGTIVALNKDGTVDIQWDDKSIARQVKSFDVRRTTYDHYFDCNTTKDPQLKAFCKFDCTSLTEPDLKAYCDYKCDAIKKPEYKGFCTAHTQLQRLGAVPDLKKDYCYGILKPDVLNVCYDLQTYARWAAQQRSSGGGEEDTGGKEPEKACLPSGSRTDDAMGNNCCSGFADSHHRSDAEDIHICK